jgi:hypothetical protein
MPSSSAYLVDYRSADVTLMNSTCWLVLYTYQEQSEGLPMQSKQQSQRHNYLNMCRVDPAVKKSFVIIKTWIYDDGHTRVKFHVSTRNKRP